MWTLEPHKFQKCFSEGRFLKENSVATQMSEQQIYSFLMLLCRSFILVVNVWSEVVFRFRSVLVRICCSNTKPTLCPPTVTNLRIEFSWKFSEACLSPFCVINLGIFHARRPGSVIFHCISMSVDVTWNKWLIFNPLTLLFSDLTLVWLNSRKADQEGEK